MVFVLNNLNIKNNIKLKIFFVPFLKVLLAINKNSFSTVSSINNINIMKTPRVLSIQSHTTHGFVGNKAATFPLQTMGFDVDCINSVSLSNHPAYAKGCQGTSLDSKDLMAFIDGLESNGLLDYDVFVTGYNRSPEVLSVIEASVKKVKSVRENVIYVCDPVLGDNGNY